METKVVNFLRGDTKHAEAIYTNGVKYLRFNGETKPLEDFPISIQIAVFNIFLRDNDSHERLRRMGLNATMEQFEQWYKCIVGGVDAIPDFTNWSQLKADSFNNTCTDEHCKFRGKSCGCEMGLNSIEVETIRCFSKGSTIAQVANQQFVTEAAIKSRINTIHYKTRSRNMAELMAVSARAGVI